MWCFLFVISISCINFLRSFTLFTQLKYDRIIHITSYGSVDDPFFLVEMMPDWQLLSWH